MFGIKYIGSDGKDVDRPVVIKNANPKKPPGPPSQKEDRLWRFNIVEGNYESVQDICDTINESVRAYSTKQETTFTAEYDSVQKKTNLRIVNKEDMNKNMHFIIQSTAPKLCKALGLVPELQHRAPDVIRPTFPTDLGIYHNMFVYYDIVGYSVVGNENFYDQLLWSKESRTEP